MYNSSDPAHRDIYLDLKPGQIYFLSQKGPMSVNYYKFTVSSFISTPIINKTKVQNRIV